MELSHMLGISPPTDFNCSGLRNLNKSTPFVREEGKVGVILSQTIDFSTLFWTIFNYKCKLHSSWGCPLREPAWPINIFISSPKFYWIIKWSPNWNWLMYANTKVSIFSPSYNYNWNRLIILIPIRFIHNLRILLSTYAQQKLNTQYQTG